MIDQSPHIASPHIVHGFFGRTGGVSTGLYEGLNCGPGSYDDPAAVAENRRIAVARLSARRDRPLATLYQVHGTDVVTVTSGMAAEFDLPQTERPKGDALVTRAPGVMLGILTADCAPVLFADPTALVIGAAHAGWRGARAGVTDATIDAMERLGASRANITAVIGPAIAQASYQVDGDFKKGFCDDTADNARWFIPDSESDTGPAPHRWRFDLTGYVKERLRQAQIHRIERINIDTYTSKNYFSYRRSCHRHEVDYGRQLSAIMLR